MNQTSMQFELKDRVAILTFNRPHKLNALDYATIDLIGRLLDEIESDPAIRAVILTGAGDRAFSAGADIEGFSESVRSGVDTALREFVRRGQRLTARFETFPKPVIAAVNGIAFGAGCEIVEAVPLAVASTQAIFGKPEIKLGFPPPFGGTQRLPRLVGRKRALQMILTADSIPAHRAAEIGLVNQVVPHADLLPEARRLAARIADMPPVAVAACLASVTRGLNVAIDEGLAIEAACFARAAGSRDIREGIESFLQKRPAQFIGA